MPNGIFSAGFPPRMVKESDGRMSAGRRRGGTVATATVAASLVTRHSCMATYQLSCACGATVAVGRGQAGGRTTCPGCGTTLPVPRLGELTRLPPTRHAAPAGRTWTAAHACLLGGAVTAVVSLASAAFLRAAPPPAFANDMIRAAVAAASTADVYRAWRGFAQSGVARPATPDEPENVPVSATVARFTRRFEL